MCIIAGKPLLDKEGRPAKHGELSNVDSFLVPIEELIEVADQRKRELSNFELHTAHQFTIIIVRYPNNNAYQGINKSFTACIIP